MMKHVETGLRTQIRYLLAVLALVAGVGLADRSALEAATPPASFYGVAGPGDTIEARFNGIVCAGATAGADGFWTFQVQSGGSCGVQEGDVLAFFRNAADSGARETFKAGGAPANVTGGVSVGGQPLGPVPAPPPLATPAPFVGAVPGSGGSALLVTAQEATPDVLKVALRGSGCELQVLAMLRVGAWAVYIEGAPAAVNSKFPASLPETTAFFVRC